MSQTRIKKPMQPRPTDWWRTGLVVLILGLLLGTLYFSSSWVHRFPSTYSTTTGTILEIRKVVDRSLDTSHGGRILYRADAHVQYTADGRPQDRWLRASDDLSPDDLEVKLAAHPSGCLVYWPPNHPEDAKCSLR
jgi:hypothetical protein